MWRLLIFARSIVQHVTLFSIIRDMLIPYGYHVYILITAYKLKRRSSFRENDIIIKNFTCTVDMNLLQLPREHPIIYFVSNIKYNTELYNWYSDVNDHHTYFSKFYIFNVCTRCIWINVTYIIPNFYRTTLLCDCSIGSTLRYIKWKLIWHLIFESSIIIEHEFISYFLVVVYSFTIFTDIMFINFSSAFAGVLIPNPPYVLSGELYHTPKIIDPDNCC